MRCLKCQSTIKNLNLARYGLHLECFETWFGVPSTSSFIGLQQRSSSSSDPIHSKIPQNNSFFHGKFKKYSAELNGQAYILKMRQEDAPELPEVEYLCNQMGQLLGIPVAEFYFIDFFADRVFVTKNFIKPSSPVDLQHIYHFMTNKEHSCEQIIQVISQKTQHPNDVSIFIKTLLFDALIGNHDRHGRNLAFITTANHTILSPIYDNVSYLSLETGNMLKADFNPTGRINTRITHQPSMSDYIKELNQLGYHDEVQAFYKKIEFNKIIQLINSSFCSNLMQEAIKSLILDFGHFCLAA